MKSIKTLVIVSGKGGVGKTTIAASVAYILAKRKKLVVADCDVDCPNLSNLLGAKLKKEKELATNYKAFANENAKNCKKELVDACAFSAISWDNKAQTIKINEFLCEGCGTCKLLCPEGITMKKVKNAQLFCGRTNYGFRIVSAQLTIGSSGSGKIVEEVKAKAKEIAAKENAELIIVDAAAGIGCPVIASLRGADFAICVTEPMPAALSDLKRVLKIAEHFSIPCGIVINKYNINPKFVEEINKFAEEKRIPILGRIPYSKEFVEATVKTLPIAKLSSEQRKIFVKIISKAESYF
ncbi:MAG: ATP-binding protein [Candidatus Diapherotrites archaeon]|nr:ATP-binding protein [Candidatus Diapherotrites archaeon]